MERRFENITRVAIDAGPPSTQTSSLNVTGLSGRVRDAVVEVDIDHTWTGDLELTLISPAGTRVLLAARRGQSGDHFRDTVFDDAATTSVRAASAPFNGRFQPEESLHVLDDQEPNGEWLLEVRDLASADGGTLNRWALTVETCCFEFENRLPVSIDAGPPSTVFSNIEVATLPGALVDSLTVQVDIRHTWNGDLDIALISPQGTRVQLARRRGGRDDDFNETVFDDAADTPIAAGQAPFASAFRPEQPLSAFEDELAAGVWSLEIVDNASQDGGRLERWAMTLMTRNAQPPAASQFSIDLNFRGGLTPNQRAVFELARARWSEIIVGDLPAATVSGQIIDDVLIDAEGTSIDGRGGILGQAGPTALRPGSQLPVTGVMAFDTADLAAMEADGSLVNVILHEMGHVLGIGTIWSRLGFLAGAGTVNPEFLGPNAMREYAALTGAVNPVPVPVANTGGAGTRDGHWREAVFGNELMTGFLGGGINPMSRLTIGMLEDLGYEVNYDAADDYQLPSSLELAVMGIGADPTAHHDACTVFYPDQHVLPESAMEGAT